MQSKQAGKSNDLVVVVTLMTHLLCYVGCSQLGGLAVGAVADDIAKRLKSPRN
jgi:hypothetical protein